jgi:hypothetical protein
MDEQKENEMVEAENEESGGRAISGKKTIASRGVPSSETLYLPSHYGGEVRSFQDDKTEAITRNLWNLEEVLNFVFAKRYQRKYYEAALSFMKLMSERLELGGSEINEFVKVSGVSKATFYNRVLPRLKRVGMLKVERDTIIAEEGKRKYRPMRITLSKTFGNYLLKIGDSWLAVVDDARSKKKV